MAEILEKFMKYGNIIDLEAIPVSLEEVANSLIKVCFFSFVIDINLLIMYNIM
jgi:hypothetical protein